VSGSTPGRKVTTHLQTAVRAGDGLHVHDAFDAVDGPLSNGSATESAIFPWELAPGYVARTTTLGGTTSRIFAGRGRIGMAIRPTAKMMIDSTIAKIGRSIKNLEKSMSAARVQFIAVCAPESAPIHGDLPWRDRRTGEEDFLRAVDDDLVAPRSAPDSTYAQARQ